MRRAARVDLNQRQIVETLRKMGASVLHLHQVGKGCPDLAVGWKGVTHLFEVKDGKAPPSRRKLTADEQAFHREWRGRPVTIVHDVWEALRAIGVPVE